MRLEPGLNLPAMMDTGIIQNQVDATNGRWNLPLQLSEQADELALPLADGCLGVDITSSRIKGGEQVEGSCSFVLVLQARGHSRTSGQCRGKPAARLQIRFLI